MYFLDNLGFFALTSLIIQCGLAWIFAGFFWVLSPGSSLWLSRWRAAFLGLGFALLAVSVRFSLAHIHLAGSNVVGEGSTEARALYAVYLGGKVAFLWFLVGGFMALRRRAWPRSRSLPWVLVGAGAAIGASLPSIETILLAQAPWTAFGLGYAAWHLPSSAKEVPELGRRIVRGVLAVWMVCWVAYGTATLVVGPVELRNGSFWSVILQTNSVVDLCLQVILAAGLIVLVLQGAQRTALAAVLESDRLREQVERDDRLRFQSTLVSGVVHELNNPLTAILGCAADLGASDAELRRDAARVVQEQAERCRVIVQRLSGLGQRQSFRCDDVDVTDLVQRVARGFERQLAPAGVALDLRLEPESWLVHADAAAIEQVLTNLLANALQASPRGARIVVSTLPTPKFLTLFVDDEGPGVPVADRPRIFEPFWTTKPAAAGTGLGLAVSAALLHALGGHIEVDDAPHGGARFVVCFPWDRLALETGAGATSGAVATPCASLEILVVDDEPQVRAAISRHAKARGWHVVEADSGAQGLSLLLCHGVQFDAVVCDLRMPGVSGVDVHDEVLEKAPHLLRRFLFVTGDVSSSEARDIATRSGAPIVQKPFVMDELLGRLGQVASLG